MHVCRGLGLTVQTAGRCRLLAALKQEVLEGGHSEQLQLEHGGHYRGNRWGLLPEGFVKTALGILAV